MIPRWTRIAMAIVVALFGSSAAAQERVWIHQFGTPGHEEAKAIAPAPGGVYLAGDTNGMLTGERQGLPDPWIARFDDEGRRIWIRQFGGSWPESAFAWALAPDGVGGAYISGEVNGAIVTPPIRYGAYDAWIARFDPAGERLWIRQIGTFGNEGIWSLAPDGHGGVFAAGDTQGSLGGTNLGGYDIFLARYNADGGLVWIRQFGSDGVDFLGSIAPDNQGGFVACGATYSSLARPHHLGADAWIGRFNSSGVATWLIQFGVSTDDWAWCIVGDDDGGAFVAGWTRGNIGGPNAGGRDAWIARYDAEGTRLWARQLGSTAADEAFAITTDGEGGVYVTGRTAGAIVPPHVAETDVWLARYSGDGDLLSLSQFGSGNIDRVHAILPDERGGVYLAGATLGNLSGSTGGHFDAWYGRFGCYADCDQSTGVGVLDIFDFLCFGADFAAGGNYACNCNASAGWDICDVLDFLCFGNAFTRGCP